MNYTNTDLTTTIYLEQEAAELRRRLLVDRMDPDTMRRVYKCPSWCERTDHDADDADRGPVMHYGPQFGRVLVQAAAPQALSAVLLEESDDLTPDALRRLAHDALAAAAWIEAQA